MGTNFWTALAAGSLLIGAALGCSSGNTNSSGGSSGSSDGGPGAGGADAGNTQTPPIGAAAIVPWLQQGFYKSWHCEAAPHTARSPSPHSVDRVCSNDVIASNATGTGPWPEGAAAVKELYTQVTDTTPGGWAVYLGDPLVLD